MCSDVWHSFAGRTGSYAIAFDYSKYAPDHEEKGRVERRKALCELAGSYVRLRGSFWVQGQESPIYEAQAMVIYGKTKEELTSAAWIAGDNYFLFYHYEENVGVEQQSLEEVKQLIASFFGNLARKHGADVETATLFRLQERVLRHPFFQYIAGGPYWVTIYENHDPQDLLKSSEHDPRPRLQACQDAITTDISASVLWGEILNNRDSIGVITAHRNGDRDQNFLRHLELKHMIRVRKNDFVEFRAGLYTDSARDFAPLYQVEATIIFGMTIKTLMRLARRLGQDTVLYCNGGDQDREFHVLSVGDYYEDPQSCSTAVYKIEENDGVLDLEKRALRGFLETLAKKAKAPLVRPAILRIQEEVILPGLHLYHVEKPLMITNYETEVNAR